MSSKHFVTKYVQIIHLLLHHNDYNLKIINYIKILLQIHHNCGTIYSAYQERWRGRPCETRQPDSQGANSR